MKISEIENRAYQWLGEDGGWQVGKPLLIDGKMQTKHGLGDIIARHKIAMQPSHASPPTWVPVENMQPYPAEPIEEPAVKGGE